MSNNPDFKKARDASQASQEAALAVMGSAQEAHAHAVQSRHESMEAMISSYDSWVSSLSAIQALLDSTPQFQKMEKAQLIALHAQCMLLAQELDGPERKYVRRLREITTRRKDLLGY